MWSFIQSFFAPPVTESAKDEEQTEVSRSSGNIWNAILTANEEQVFALVEKDAKIIDSRGPVGETPLHMCFLFHSPAHLELAKKIMDRFPHTITAEYAGSEYGGENVLHIAIINQDFPSVKMLVSREPKLLTGRAHGNFFKEGQACYYGEYPLSFAGCTNQPDMVTLLLDHGADMEAVDGQNGNNILHMLVIHNLPEMYSFVKKEYIKRVKNRRGELDNSGNKFVDLWLRPNNDGLTPFTLAANLGQKDMFSFLLEETKQMQWTYGPVSCFIYPLQELDLHISKEGDHSPVLPGALELIMNNAHVELLMHPRMIDLVKQKWDRFAQRIFKQRFTTVLMYLILFTITTVIRQSVEHISMHEEKWAAFGGDEGGEATAAAALRAAQEAAQASGNGNGDGSLDVDPLDPATWRDTWCYFFYAYPPLLWLLQLAVFAGAMWKGNKEVSEMWASGLSYFSSSGSALLENTLSCLYCLSIFVATFLQLIGSPLERAVLAAASITGWSYLFFFLLAFRLTGPMVVMIYQMLMNDVLRFCVIYLVFLMGFAQAFFVLFESVGWSGFIVSIKTCFVAMLGDFELDQFADTPYTAVSVGLLVVYVVTITILLLNLLVAMMGDTYEKINEAAEMQWHLERARIVFAIENEMSSEEREDPRNKYWTNVDGARFLQVLEVRPDHFKKGTPDEIREEEEEEKKEGEQDDY